MPPFMWIYYPSIPPYHSLENYLYLFLLFLLACKTGNPEIQNLSLTDNYTARLYGQNSLYDRCMGVLLFGRS